MKKDYVTRIYKNNKVELEIKIDLNYENVWLNQDDIANLYKVSRSWINKKILEINKINQLDTRSCAILSQLLSDGRIYNKKHYSLEIIEKIGFKINLEITKDFLNFSNNLLKKLKDESTKKWLPIEVFETNSIKLEVKINPYKDTVLLTRNQLAKLYEISKSTISKHIKSILDNEELDSSVVAQIATTGSDGKVYKVNYYDLDMILAIGYKVRSHIGTKFRKWTTDILKKYMKKGYVINEERMTNNLNEYKDLLNNTLSINAKVHKLESIIDNHENRIENLEIKKESTKDSIFFNGEFYNSHSKILDIIKEANYSITLIDNYIGKETLDLLCYKKSNVKITLVTNKEYFESSLNEITINKFNKQYGKINIKYSSTFHDRFLIIDNTKLYHIGASLKDIGKKCFAISELSKSFIFIILEKVNL